LRVAASWSTSPPNSVRSGLKGSPTTGIIGLTKSLAREVSAQGVRVNAVAPGPVNTLLVIDNLPEEWREDKATELPLGRLGEPYEVADTVSFLVSDAAALYVGQTLGPNSGDVML
jgi:3-oxoacyl-[acyl-carrier protein] reductase